MEEHPEIWSESQPWFEKLDLWVTGHVVPEYAYAVAQLGGWQRHPDNCLDFHSSAYEDMMFFHPFVRKAFFDTGDSDPRTRSACPSICYSRKTGLTPVL
jgi:hypothetical protein